MPASSACVHPAIRGLVEDRIDVAPDQRLEGFGIRPGHAAGLAHFAAPARDVVARKARRRGDVVEHEMQAMVERAAHQDAQLRFSRRDVLEARQAGFGPHREDELVRGRDDGDRAHRHRLLEDAVAAHRHGEHGGGIDDRKIDLARCHRENALRRTDGEQRRRPAAMRMPQHHLGLDIIRHRVARGAARHFGGDFEHQTRARHVGIGLCTHSVHPHAACLFKSQLNAPPFATPSPRVRGEGWGEGAFPPGSELRQRPLTLARFAHSTSPRARGEVNGVAREPATISRKPGMPAISRCRAHRAG